MGKHSGPRAFVELKLAHAYRAFIRPRWESLTVFYIAALLTVTAAVVIWDVFA